MHNAVRTVHIGLHPKKVQFRKAKLFEFNEKHLNPHFFLV